MVENDITYAVNINFLISNMAGANTLIDLGTLSAIADEGGEYPTAYFDPTDASTDVKVSSINMDVYYPDLAEDEISERPVMIYVHTGNFLPPPLNGSTTGLKTDSAAVNLCMQWAKRGYVAVSMDYRLGWNPLAPTVQERRGTLLNAVYRSLQDVKMGVRYLRADAAADNAWGIDESKMVLYGQGSGGYISTTYGTLDNASVELFLEKFIPNPFEPETSYIDTLLVGTIDGFGYPNSVNLYRDNGISSDINMSINAGGAMADESWLEAGDIPQVAIACVRDDFAPFTEGTVIVGTTGEEVVDVHGSNFFIQKANDLGNNDVFADLPDGDVFTDNARMLYGQSFDGSNASTITVNDTPEGLLPLIRPLYGFLQNESAPWEWWDPEGPIGSTIIDPENGITAHMAASASNPDMSAEKGLAYLDSIQGYILPRVMCVLALPNNPCDLIALEPDNDECVQASDINGLFGGAPSELQMSGIYNNEYATPEYDTDNAADVEDCWGESSFDVEPVMNNTTWYTFEGDGNEYLIETGNCGGTATDYIDFGDTQMQIYTGDCEGGLVPVEGACNEDSENAVLDNYFAGMTFMTEESTTYYILIDGFNGDGVAEVGVQADGEFCIEVTNLGESIDGVDAVAFSLYPNPANELVRITATANIDQLEVRNALGQSVMAQGAANNQRVVLDTQSLEAGVYMVTVTAGGTRSTQRLVIR